MHYEEINKEIRELREHCPVTCSSVTGTGPGECYCCPKPPPPVPPKPPEPQCCVTRVVIRNSGRYTINSNGTITKTCC